MRGPAPLPGSEWLVDACRFALGTGAAPGAPAVSDHEIVRLVDRHRVVGLLGPFHDTLGLSEPASRRLARLHHSHDRHGLSVAGAMALVTGRLDSLGIRALAFKGPALSVVMGDEAHQRGVTDVDIWIERADLAATVDALATLGWTPSLPERSPLLDTPAWRRRVCDTFEKSMSLVHPDRVSVDVHWRLNPSATTLPITFDEAWDRSVALPAISPATRALGPADALRHVAAHHNHDAWPMMRHVVDIVRLGRIIDSNELTALARTDHDIALALAVAARLDTRYDDYRARHRRLAERAWAECSSTRLQLPDLRTSTGRDAIALRAARLDWQVRATRPRRAALHPLGESMLPFGALRDPRPLPRALADEARRLRARLSRPGH